MLDSASETRLGQAKQCKQEKAWRSACVNFDEVIWLVLLDLTIGGGWELAGMLGASRGSMTLARMSAWLEMVQARV